MKPKPTTPIDSFPGTLSTPISYLSTKTLYWFTVRHLYSNMCQCVIQDYNSLEVLVDAVHNIDFIDSLIIPVNNLKIATILYGKS